MAPRRNKDIKKTTCMLLTRSELLQMIDTTRQAQENLTKSHYPEILWTGSSGHGFSKPKYKRGWKPDPNVPPRLNSLEAAEYAEGYSRAHRQEPTEKCPLEQHHSAGKKMCKDIHNLSAFRVWRQLSAPADDAAGFKTPARHEQDLKNDYETMRKALNRQLKELLELQKTKSDHPTNLPRRRPDEDDDQDHSGKGQGNANSSLPLLPRAAAA